MTNRGDVERLRSANARVTELAKQRITELFAGIDFNVASPELVRDALLEVVPALVAEYGDLAASAAAQWYEETRAKQLSGAYRALLAERLPEEQITQSVRWAVGPLWDGNVELVASRLLGAVQRHLSYSTRQTIARNVGRDRAKPRLARVPRGVVTCKFCLMLASRGFVYHSKETAGELMKFHDDCDCQIVAEWDKDAHHIEGYDPDELYRQYLAERNKSKQQRSGSSMGDSRVIRGGVIPADWVKGKRIVDAFGGNEVYPGKFTNPETASLEPHELKSVQKLLSSGQNIEWLLESAEPGAKTPDARIDGVLWEFKAIIGLGSNTIENSIKNAKKKSSNIVVDLSETIIPIDEFKARASHILRSDTSFILISGDVVERWEYLR